MFNSKWIKHIALCLFCLAILIGFHDAQDVYSGEGSVSPLSLTGETPDPKGVYDIYIEATPGTINLIQKVGIHGVTDFVGKSFLIVTRVINEKMEKAYIDFDKVRMVVPATGFDLAAV